MPPRLEGLLWATSPVPAGEEGWAPVWLRSPKPALFEERKKPNNGFLMKTRQEEDVRTVEKGEDSCAMEKLLQATAAHAQSAQGTRRGGHRSPAQERGLARRHIW